MPLHWFVRTMNQIPELGKGAKVKDRFLEALI